MKTPRVVSLPMGNMMAAARKVPVVVVLGATGTGKSKLAIELGRHFNGEIISADSMQMYKGLDIITNKVTAEEQAQCPHHLLSILSPLSMNNTVVDFRNMALPIVERLCDENKMPIIVGGTNYYIEALLWDFLIDKQTAELAHQAQPSNTVELQTSSKLESGSGTSAVSTTGAVPVPASAELDAHRERSSTTEHSLPSESAGDTVSVVAGSDTSFPDSASVNSGSGNECMSVRDEGGDAGECGRKELSKARREKEGKYANLESAHLYSVLQTVDPESAKRLHPKNRRKIVRALQVYEDYGVPMSRIHQAQHRNGNTPGLSGALRFPHCCVFWLQSEQKVLEERLDRRVDNMLKSGLVSELHSLHTLYLDSIAAQNGEPDYTLGIFQSIGFKEFHDYLILPPDQQQTPRGRALFDKGVEGLKLATRQYARRQLKWIRNRFLKRPGVQVPAVYGLDSTDPSQWSHNVLQPAIRILSAISTGSEVPAQPLTLDAERTTVHVHNVCDVCDGRVFTMLHEWQEHLGGRKHKKMLQRKRRQEKAEAEAAQQEAKQCKTEC